MSREILVVVAHPDDETLGAGGTIRRLVNEGDSVFVGVLADGVSSRTWPQNVIEMGVKDIQIIERQGQAERAFNILGVRDFAFIRFSDQRLDEKPILAITKKIEDWIQIWKPQIVFTHSNCDINRDHRIVHEATLTACRPHKTVVKEILAFEIPHSTEIGLRRYNPTVFYDISDTLDTKKRAFECYKEKYPNPQYIETLAKRYGYVVGCQAAEAFELVRWLR